MGKHSRHLQVALNIVYDLLNEDEEMGIEEACMRACLAKNERAMVRGFTAIQSFLGRGDSPIASICQGNFGEMAAAAEEGSDFY